MLSSSHDSESYPSETLANMADIIDVVEMSPSGLIRPQALWPTLLADYSKSEDFLKRKNLLVHAHNMALDKPPAGLVFKKGTNPVIVISGVEDDCCVALARTKDHKVCTGI